MNTAMEESDKRDSMQIYAYYHSKMSDWYGFKSNIIYSNCIAIS